MLLLRRTWSSKFGILCYHRVGTQGVPLFSRLDPKVFEAQMCYLRNHYRIVSLSQLCDELQEDRQVKPTLAVTFDDGYRDLYTYAFPVLQQYGIPATIYLIGQCMETGEVPWYDKIFVMLSVASEGSLELEIGSARRFELSSAAKRAQSAWEIVSYLRALPDHKRREWCSNFERQFRLPTKELQGRMLDWGQVRTMQRAGIQFGAHTMTHPSVSRLEPAAFPNELGLTKQRLESKLGVPVDHFAYPFGKSADCSLAAEEFLRLCKYRSAATTIEGVNLSGTNCFRLRRLQVGEESSLGTFAFNLSQIFLEMPSRQIRKSQTAGIGEANVTNERG